MKNEYTSLCDKCYQRGWHEVETPCVRKYAKKCYECVHPHTLNELVQCTGINRIIDNSELPELTPGARYSFKDKTGKVKRYTFGKTTGWKPVGLLMHNARSTGSSYTLKKSDILNSIYARIIEINTYHE